MTVTASYGSWNRWVPSTASLLDEVSGALNGEYDAEFVDRVASAYRAAINAALPDSVSLNGDEFYGPYHERDRDFDGYPRTTDGALYISAIIESVDFWAIVQDAEEADAR